MKQISSLDAVLRLRQHHEKLQERALTSLHAKRQANELSLVRLDSEVVRLHRERTETLQRTVPAAHLQILALQATSLREAQLSVKHERQQLEETIRRQTEAYLGAKRNREVISELLTRRSAALQQHLALREARNLEDLVSSRMARARTMPLHHEKNESEEAGHPVRVSASATF